MKPQIAYLRWDWELSAEEQSQAYANWWLTEDNGHITPRPPCGAQNDIAPTYMYSRVHVLRYIR
jgi:hypothetical protein